MPLFQDNFIFFYLELEIIKLGFPYYPILLGVLKKYIWTYIQRISILNFNIAEFSF